MHAKPPLSPLTLPDYVTAEQTAWRVNANAAYTNNPPVSAQRIDTRIWRFGNNPATIFGNTPAAIRAKINSDPMFAATFAQSPMSTGFEKPVAHQWLTQHLNLPAPATGAPAIGTLLHDQNALYVTDTGVITTFAGKPKPSKALNFHWNTKNLDFYALHKYTPNSGGQQGRQLEQELKILTNFQQATDPNVVLIVIVDGDYYDDIAMNRLRSLTKSNRPRSFAVHIQDVPWAVGLCP